MSFWKEAYVCLGKGSCLSGKWYMSVWKGDHVSGKELMAVWKWVYACLERGLIKLKLVEALQ